MLSQNDMIELKRMSTNMSGEDKVVINKIIRAIGELMTANRKLFDENKKLKGEE